MATLTSEVTKISLTSGAENQQPEKEAQVKLLSLCSKKNKKNVVRISSICEQPGHEIDTSKLNVIHDTALNMFSIKLEYKRNVALCYLPTRVKKVVEFYHIEIPFILRNKGLGDLLVTEALNWAKETGTRVIPSCPFIQQHILRTDIIKKWKDVIVNSEEEGMELVKREEITYII